MRNGHKWEGETMPGTNDPDPCVVLTAEILDLMRQLRKLARHSSAFDEVQRQIVGPLNPS